MAKYGKWIGAGLGFVLGGPLGALLGLFIGSTLENVQSANTHAEPTTNHSRGDFLFSLTVLATAIMKADQRIMRSELEYVKDFFKRNFGLEATQEAMGMIKKLSEHEIPLMEVYKNIPTPAPRYNNPAIIVGDTYSVNNLESGILMAYSAAAKIANNVARIFLFILYPI